MLKTLKGVTLFQINPDHLISFDPQMGDPFVREGHVRKEIAKEGLAICRAAVLYYPDRSAISRSINIKERTNNVLNYT